MLDTNLLFEPVAGTAVTVTAPSTNVIDMLSARDVGAGDDLEAHVQVLTTFTAAGAATMQIAYQTSPDNITFVNVLLSPLYAVASLVPGVPIFRYKVPIFQLLDTGTPNRYHRLNYTIATGPMTAGALTAYMTGGGDRQVYSTYPRGYTISA